MPRQGKAHDSQNTEEVTNPEQGLGEQWAETALWKEASWAGVPSTLQNRPLLKWNVGETQ